MALVCHDIIGPISARSALIGLIITRYMRAYGPSIACYNKGYKGAKRLYTSVRIRIVAAQRAAYILLYTEI